MLTSDWLLLLGQEGGHAETRGGEARGGHEHPLQPLRQTLQNKGEFEETCEANSQNNKLN